MISTDWEDDSIVLPEPKTSTIVQKVDLNLPWEGGEDRKRFSKELGEKWEWEWEMVPGPIWPGPIVALARLSHPDAHCVDEGMNMRKKDAGSEMISRPNTDHRHHPDNHSSWIPSPSIFTSTSGTTSIPFPTGQLKEAYWHLLETN
jgi:hypothetical protein